MKFLVYTHRKYKSKLENSAKTEVPGGALAPNPCLIFSEQKKKIPVLSQTL